MCPHRFAGTDCGLMSALAWFQKFPESEQTASPSTSDVPLTTCDSRSEEKELETGKTHAVLPRWVNSGPLQKRSFAGRADFREGSFKAWGLTLSRRSEVENGMSHILLVVGFQRFSDDIVVDLLRRLLGWFGRLRGWLRRLQDRHVCVDLLRGVGRCACG